jgi:hypothetical protein
MVKQLKKEARQRDTSTNAEIRRRLQWSFDYEEFIAQERQRHAIPSKHDAANVSHQPNAISEKRNTEG